MLNLTMVERWRKFLLGQRGKMSSLNAQGDVGSRAAAVLTANGLRGAARAMPRLRVMSAPGPTHFVRDG